MKSIFCKYLFALLIFFAVGNQLVAQPVGFGCLGLSGFFAGYSQQKYSAPGINEFVTNQKLLIDPTNTLFKDNSEFKTGTGYRIGANFFRARFSSLFISAKGYYQFLKETHEYSGQISAVTRKEKFELKLNHWGVGVDVGVPIFSILDWKIVEGNIMFFNSEFSQETFFDEVSQGEVRYTPEKNKIGYFIGTGLIIHLVPDYISIEGTAGYNNISIDALNGDNFTIPLSGSTKKAIDKGEFSATIQLNVGFPL